MASAPASSVSRHELPIALPFGVNSVALWSTDPDGSLIIFVHGFGGNATGTWNDMLALLPRDSRAARADLVFYGYHSTQRRAVMHAEDLLDALEDLFADRPPYSRIVLAAHSLGAVVVRRAIIVAFRETRSWVGNVRAVLFAPAHRGASIQKLIAHASGIAFLPLLYSVFQFKAPVLQDLHPTDSQFLKDMQTEYATAIDALPDPVPPLVASVLFGREDSIVEPFDYHPKEGFKSLPGHDHFSICKPHSAFRAPIDLVVKALAK